MHGACQATIRLLTHSRGWDPMGQATSRVARRCLRPVELLVGRKTSSARGIPFFTQCERALCTYLHLNCVSRGSEKGRVGKVRTARKISWIRWERFLFGI